MFVSYVKLKISEKIVTKTSFLGKLVSTLALGSFSPSQKITESRTTRYPYGTYL